MSVESLGSLAITLTVLLSMVPWGLMARVCRPPGRKILESIGALAFFLGLICGVVVILVWLVLR